jgi:hypothetical protein
MDHEESSVDRCDRCPRPRFAERKVVLGGTGQFAGATGFLFFTGQGLGPFDADVTGEICLQN